VYPSIPAAFERAPFAAVAAKQITPGTALRIYLRNLRIYLRKKAGVDATGAESDAFS
jgi:hypothetical protein